jgi:hypothetical protein
MRSLPVIAVVVLATATLSLTGVPLAAGSTCGGIWYPNIRMLIIINITEEHSTCSYFCTRIICMKGHAVAIGSAEIWSGLQGWG